MDPMYYPHPQVVQANAPLHSAFDSQLEQNLKNVNNTLDETEEHTGPTRRIFKISYMLETLIFLAKLKLDGN